MNIGRNIRHLSRYRQIVKVFLKHGLGYVIHRLGLETLVPMTTAYSLKKCEREPDYCIADKLTHALMELGPTFVKFGQLLSTRPDILSPAFIEELENLQDKVLPFSFEKVKEQIASELGDPDLVFACIDPLPLAAASIGQVHRARLHTGEEVIIKIQRPDIIEQVQNDLEMMEDLAAMIEKHSADAARIGVLGIVEDYAKMFRFELDYWREAKNTERMRTNFSGDPTVIIPRIFWEYTTHKILTEEYIDGVKVSDITAIEAKGWDRRKLSYLGTRSFLTQVMVHGFFQADPHPGNMLIIDEEHIAFIDFGETGALTGTRLANVGMLLMGIDNRDSDQALSALYDMGILNDKLNLDDFEADFIDIVEQVYATEMGNIDMNRLRQDILELAFRYELRLPKYLTALMKALITVEGVGKKLDPSFNFSEAARPVVEQVFKQRFTPEEMLKMAKRSFYRDIKPLLGIPRNFNNFFKEASTGNFKMQHELGVKPHSEIKLTQLANRISASLIIAGGMVSTSLLLMASDHPAQHLNDVMIVTSIGILLIGVYSFVISGRRG